MAGQRPLESPMEVRILLPQPHSITYIQAHTIFQPYKNRPRKKPGTAFLCDPKAFPMAGIFKNEANDYEGIGSSASPYRELEGKRSSARGFFGSW
jgi:hypothetical protein